MDFIVRTEPHSHHTNKVTVEMTPETKKKIGINLILFGSALLALGLAYPVLKDERTNRSNHEDN